MKRTAAALTILAVAPFATKAGGFAVLEIGTQRTGMKATVARGTDLTTVFSNPGGLARLKGTRFYTSIMPIQIKAKFRIQQDDGTYTDWVKPTKSFGVVPFIGASSDFGLDHTVFALSFYFPNLSASSVPEDSPLRYHVIDAYFINWFLTGSAAYEIHPKVSVGVGASYVSALQYYETMLDLATVEIPGLPPLSGDALLKAKPRGNGFVWNAGILVGPFRGLKIGLSYTSREWLDMEGSLEAEGLLYDAFPAKLAGTFSQRKPIPDYFRLGFNYQAGPDWQIGLDWTLWHYNIYQRSIRTISGDLTVPDLIEGSLGVSYTTVSEKDFGNSYNLAAGVERRLSRDSSFSIGVEYDRSPIPDKTFSVDNATSDFVGVGAGYERRISGKWILGSTVGFQRQQSRDVTDSITVPRTNVKTRAYAYRASISFRYGR